MNNFVSKQIDPFIDQYADSNPIWIVTLSNGETVYQDDDRPDAIPASAWQRLGNYCRDNGIYITSMKIKNRSHVETVGEGGDGYYFCKAAGKFLFDGRTDHSFIVGVLDNGKLRVRKWNLPEIVPEEFEDRKAIDTDPCLIAKIV